MNPPILEFAMRVVRKCRDRTFVNVGRYDQASFEQTLKAIADAENQTFLVAEFTQHIGEKMLQLNRENFASCNVIAVCEAAGNRHNLVLQQEFRIVAQSLNVQAIDEGAGFFERELRFGIAVGARSTQDQDTWLAMVFPWFRRLPARPRRRQTAAAPRDIVDLRFSPRMSAKVGEKSIAASRVHSVTCVANCFFLENISQTVDSTPIRFVYFLCKSIL